MQFGNAGEQKRHAVFDFLYCDVRRVGSLLAQFNPSGYLTQQRRTKSQADDAGLEASIGFDLGVIKGTTGGKSSSGESDQAEEVYDPFWTGAVALLSHLEKRLLLKRDMRRAGIGQLALLSGHLKLLDLSVLETVWKVPSLTASLVGKTEGKSQAEIDENKLSLEFVKSMPHTVQAEILCEPQGDIPGSVSWMILDPTSLVIPPGDILMKYGQRVPGIWSILAIKDAVPDLIPAIDEELKKDLAAGTWLTAAAKRNTTAMALLASTLAPRAREMMGRPSAYYGVTPIMIFRDVAGNTEAV